MGMEFEKMKKKFFSTNLPIPEKLGRVRGNKNIFKVGLANDIFLPEICTLGWKYFHSL